MLWLWMIVEKQIKFEPWFAGYDFVANHTWEIIKWGHFETVVVVDDLCSCSMNFKNQDVICWTWFYVNPISEMVSLGYFDLFLDFNDCWEINQIETITFGIYILFKSYLRNDQFWSFWECVGFEWCPWSLMHFQNKNIIAWIHVFVWNLFEKWSVGVILRFVWFCMICCKF